MSENIIETHNLTVYYGQYRGVKDVNLTVERGEAFGFLGPNSTEMKRTFCSVPLSMEKASGVRRLHLYSIADSPEFWYKLGSSRSLRFDAAVPDTF